jgi:hypothetical protein
VEAALAAARELMDVTELHFTNASVRYDLVPHDWRSVGSAIPLAIVFLAFSVTSWRMSGFGAKSSSSRGVVSSTMTRSSLFLVREIRGSGDPR